MAWRGTKAAARRGVGYTAAAMSKLQEEHTLSIFPLTGQLLLPGTYMPLNIFEERYLNLVEDALQGDRRIGMVQPMIPGLDNWGVPPLDLNEPELYPVGCCGHLDQSELQEDGRYLIVLEGVIRFRIIRELKPVRGYRRVTADIAEFEIDRHDESSTVDQQEILSVLEVFARQSNLAFDLDLLGSLSGRRLVNTLSAALPFTPVEKQALLEARSIQDRANLLTGLMGMDLETDGRPELYSPPTIN